MPRFKTARPKPVSPISGAMQRCRTLPAFAVYLELSLGVCTFEHPKKPRARHWPVAVGAGRRPGPLLADRGDSTVLGVVLRYFSLFALTSVGFLRVCRRSQRQRRALEGTKPVATASDQKSRSGRSLRGRSDNRRSSVALRRAF